MLTPSLISEQKKTMTVGYDAEFCNTFNQEQINKAEEIERRKKSDKENSKLQQLLNDLGVAENIKNKKVDLFTAPKKLTEDELQQLKEDFKGEKYSFKFSFDDKSYFLGFLEGEPFIRVSIDGNLPENFSEEQKDKFKRTVDEKGYIYDFGKIPENSQTESKDYTIDNGRRNFVENGINNFFQNVSLKKFSTILDKANIEKSKIEQAKTLFINKDFDALKSFFTNKEIFTNEEITAVSSSIESICLPRTQTRTIDEVATHIKNKKVLFYTGAGISKAGDIPDMKTLENNLGISGKEITDTFLDRFLDDPKNAFQPRSDFCFNSINNEPTKAHYALKNLSQKMSCQIFTENIDFLQKNTGIQDYHIYGPWLKDNVSNEDIKQIDYIITIGLSGDDRGMLQRYKENNPDGKIIAFNLQQPNYLGEEDILVEGDIQETLIELDKSVTKNTP